MKQKFWLFGLILVIPILGFITSQAIISYTNSEVRKSISINYPDADPIKVSQITAEKLCKDDKSGIEELCEQNSNLVILRSASISTGIVGLFLLFLIKLSGKLAQKNRLLLLTIFKPGLNATGLALIVLVILHSCIAMASIYYAESALTNRIHVFVIGGIGLGALYGIVAISKNAFSLIRNAQSYAIGLIVKEDEQEQLWKHINEIADRMGSLKPDNIVLGLEPNFYVTEADVISLNGECHGRTLYCSLPFMRILHKDEFNGVIGHELGHYKGQDTKFSREFYPIYRGTINSIQALSEAGSRGSSVIALLPALAIFGYFLESFSVAENAISRERELLADKEGAKISSNESMSICLVKIHAYSGIWNYICENIVKALKQNKMYKNASLTYFETSKINATEKILNGIAETHTAHPTDSHPPLSVRLNSLGYSVKDLVEKSLLLSETDSSINLINGYESIEMNVSDAYQSILARKLNIHFDDADKEQENENPTA
jgi:Zn-dependent protease with chaperone function